MAKDQEFVVYNGMTMIAGWPEQIEAAQQVTTVSIGGKEVGRVRYGDERNDWGADKWPCPIVGSSRGSIMFLAAMSRDAQSAVAS